MAIVAPDEWCTADVAAVKAALKITIAFAQVHGLDGWIKQCCNVGAQQGVEVVIVRGRMIARVVWSGGRMGCSLKLIWLFLQVFIRVVKCVLFVVFPLVHLFHFVVQVVKCVFFAVLGEGAAIDGHGVQVAGDLNF